MSDSARRRATAEDFWAIPEETRFHELIGGEIVEKASPSGEHGGAQAGVIAAVRSFQGAVASGASGWWITAPVEVQLETGDVVRPDVVGWSRERCPDRPTGFPIRVRPDWVCEVVSPGHVTHDTVKKLRLYHRVGIPNYWLVDPQQASLTVLRWSAEGYITVLVAERGETVRPEPFEAIELVVGTLFGDDPPA